MSGVTVIQAQDISNDQELIGVNSGTLDFMDPVTISSGFLARITSSSPVEGFFEGAVGTTFASNNQTVAKVKGQYDPNWEEVVVQINTLSGVALVQSNIGQFFNVNVTNGVITIDTATFGTTGQFQLMDFDPNRDGTTTIGVATVALPQELSFAPHT